MYDSSYRVYWGNRLLSDVYGVKLNFSTENFHFYVKNINVQKISWSPQCVDARTLQIHDDLNRRGLSSETNGLAQRLKVSWFFRSELSWSNWTVFILFFTGGFKNAKITKTNSTIEIQFLVLYKCVASELKNPLYCRVLPLLT